MVFIVLQFPPFPLFLICTALLHIWEKKVKTTTTMLLEVVYSTWQWMSWELSGSYISGCTNQVHMRQSDDGRSWWRHPNIWWQWQINNVAKRHPQDANVVVVNVYVVCVRSTGGGRHNPHQWPEKLKIVQQRWDLPCTTHGCIEQHLTCRHGEGTTLGEASYYNQWWHNGYQRHWWIWSLFPINNTHDLSAFMAA